MRDTENGGRSGGLSLISPGMSGWMCLHRGSLCGALNGSGDGAVRAAGGGWTQWACDPYSTAFRRHAGSAFAEGVCCVLLSQFSEGSLQAGEILQEAFFGIELFAMVDDADGAVVV